MMAVLEAEAKQTMEANDEGKEITGELWQPLRWEDSIRLFQLSRDKASSRLRFSLTEHRLSNHPSYMALSYTWGRAEDMSVIENVHKPCALRRNLFTFLSTLHKLMTQGKIGMTTFFWVDALCINQESPEEKARQVQQIASTFQQASKMFAWLGTHQDNLGSCLPPISGESWQRFESHAYWTRLWIIQEFMLPEKLILVDENYEMPVDEVLFRYDQSFVGKLANARFMYQNHLDYRKMTSGVLLSSFGHHQCSDMRDKIYALLSLCMKQHRMDVDYTISVGYLFWKVLYHEQNHDIIGTNARMQTLGLNISHLFPRSMNQQTSSRASSIASKYITFLEWEQLISCDAMMSPTIRNCEVARPQPQGFFRSKSWRRVDGQTKIYLASGQICPDDLYISFPGSQLNLVLREDSRFDLETAHKDQVNYKICGVFVEQKAVHVDNSSEPFFQLVLQQPIGLHSWKSNGPQHCIVSAVTYNYLVLMHITLSYKER